MHSLMNMIATSRTAQSISGQWEEGIFGMSKFLAITVPMIAPQTGLLQKGNGNYSTCPHVIVLTMAQVSYQAKTEN